MRYKTIRQIQRFFITLCSLAMLGIILFVIQNIDTSLSGFQSFWQQTNLNPPLKTIALISGHAENDSGAICTGTNGQVLLREVDINAQVSTLVTAQLTNAGFDVLLLDEYDQRLNGLQVDLLLSLHADSCVDVSGYKAARSQHSPIAEIEDRLIQCIDTLYAATTDLAPHPNTLTHDMTNYYAFNRIAPDTPAAILEMGFMGGDQQLLVGNPERVAQGIVESLLCFLNEEEENEE